MLTGDGGSPRPRLGRLSSRTLACGTFISELLGANADVASVQKRASRAHVQTTVGIGAGGGLPRCGPSARRPCLAPGIVLEPPAEGRLPYGSLRKRSKRRRQIERVQAED
jgi:hypothetical protein